jgi:hypothetical protein
MRSLITNIREDKHNSQQWMLSLCGEILPDSKIHVQLTETSVKWGGSITMLPTRQTQNERGEAQLVLFLRT